MLIYRDLINRLFLGDCLGILRTLPENSLDCMVTDPPYGLRFMGKKWDCDVPSIEIWRECLRVLKPGAHALIFAGSRTQHRMAVNVEDAGFLLKDTLMWIYGSGFPKSLDISKACDKTMGKENVIGKGKAGANALGQKSGWNKTYNSHEYNITAPATPEAKLWNGWGTHLKPAYEPIILAMKPNAGSYAANALEYGVAGINVDAGRIGLKGEMPPTGSGNVSKNTNTDILSHAIGKDGVNKTPSKGRFPANILLDEESARMLDEQSGVLKSGKMKPTFTKAMGYVAEQEASQGGASRFFYCAKAPKKERGAFNRHPTVKPLKLMEYLCRLLKTPTGGTVLDPFGGSGTTALAATAVGMGWLLIEQDINSCRTAIRRINEF